MTLPATGRPEGRLSCHHPVKEPGEAPHHRSGTLYIGACCHSVNILSLFILISRHYDLIACLTHHARTVCQVAHCHWSMPCLPLSQVLHCPMRLPLPLMLPVLHLAGTSHMTSHPPRLASHKGGGRQISTGPMGAPPLRGQVHKIFSDSHRFAKTASGRPKKQGENPAFRAGPMKIVRTSKTAIDFESAQSGQTADN